MDELKENDKIRVIDETIGIEIMCKVDKIEANGTIKLKNDSQ